MQAVSGALLLTLNPKMQQLLLMITMMMMNTRLRSMVPRTTLMMLVTTKLKMPMMLVTSLTVIKDLDNDI